MGDPNEVDLYRVILHRRLAPLPALDLEAVDLVLMSHAHEDHFDQEAQARLDRDLRMILPTADVEKVRAMGFRNLDGLRWGETRRFEIGNAHVTIIAVPARHSRNPQMAEMLGSGNGYWIELSIGEARQMLYWTGDTLPTSDVVAAVGELGVPDLMMANVGGVGVTGPLGQISMGATDVVELADLLRPRGILPVHHSTYAFYREPIDQLVERSEGKPYRLILLDEGATAVCESGIWLASPRK